MIHTAQNREMLVAAMIDGRKHASAESAVRTARPIAGMVMVDVIAAFAGGLYANYDPAAHHTYVPLLGTNDPTRRGRR